MRKISILLAIAFSALMTLNAQHKEIIPYVEFLKTHQTDPVDYIFQLFEKYDIVILGERDHRDTTQYIFVEKLISDSRFINEVGNVFTEVGCFNRKDWINQVLKGKYANQPEFETALRKVYRELDWGVLWEKYNYWMFLNSIYKVNKNVPDKKKITLYPMDVEYDWSKCESQQDREADWDYVFKNTGRDSIMATNFIRNYDQILPKGNEKQAKALVILNA